MRNAGLDEPQVGIKIAEKGKWKSWLEIQLEKTKIMAFCPITSWQIDGETVEKVADFILGGSKITAESDCSHEIRRHSSLEGKIWQT